MLGQVPGPCPALPCGEGREERYFGHSSGFFLFQLHNYLSRDVWGNRYKKGNSVGKLGFPHIERKRRFVCLLAGGRSKSSWLLSDFFCWRSSS